MPTSATSAIVHERPTNTIQVVQVVAYLICALYFTVWLPLSLPLLTRYDVYDGRVIASLMVDTVINVLFLVATFQRYQKSRHQKAWFRRNDIRRDIVSFFPYELLALASSGLDTCLLIRLIRFLGLAPHLVRLATHVQQLCQSLTMRRVSYAISRLIKLVFLAVLSIHFWGCIWLWVARDEGYGSWQLPGCDPNSSVHRDCNSFQAEYTLAYYWSSTTFTTVGYGDIVPETNAEVILTIVVEAIGVTFCAVIIAAVTSAIVASDAAENHHENKLGHVQKFCHNVKISEDISTKIQAYYADIWKYLSFDAVEILSALPRSLRQDAVSHLMGDIYRTKFPDFPQGLLVSLSTSLQPSFHPVNVVLVRENATRLNLSFLLRGSAHRSITTDIEGGRETKVSGIEIMRTSLARGSLRGGKIWKREKKLMNIDTLGPGDCYGLLAAGSLIESRAEGREESYREYVHGTPSSRSDTISKTMTPATYLRVITEDGNSSTVKMLNQLKSQGTLKISNIDSNTSNSIKNSNGDNNNNNNNTNNNNNLIHQNNHNSGTGLGGADKCQSTQKTGVSPFAGAEAKFQMKQTKEKKTVSVVNDDDRFNLAPCITTVSPVNIMSISFNNLLPVLEHFPSASDQILEMARSEAKRVKTIQKQMCKIGAAKKMGIESDVTITETGKGIILPDRRFRVIWDIFLLIVLIYYTVIVPYQTCYQYDSNNSDDEKESALWDPSTTCLNYLCDAFCVADILLRWFKFAVVVDNSTITDQKEFSGLYMRSGFALHVASSLPLDILFGFIDTSRIPFLRLPRLVHLLRFGGIVAGIESYFSNSGIQINSHSLRILRYFIQLCITFYISAFVFVMIGISQDDQDESTSWRARDDNAPHESELMTMMRSVYFVIVTMTTIGSGDITPFSDLEIGFAMAIQLMGMFLLPAIIGYLSAATDNLNPVENSHKDRVNLITKYLELRKIPHNIQTKIFDYYSYFWEKHLGISENEVLGNLPGSLYLEVVRFMHASTLRGFSAFEKCPKEFLLEILRGVELRIFSPHTHVQFSGETGHEIYHIVQGTLEFESDRLDGLDLDDDDSSSSSNGQDLPLPTHDRNNFNVEPVSYSRSASPVDMFRIDNHGSELGSRQSISRSRTSIKKKRHSHGLLFTKLSEGSSFGEINLSLFDSAEPVSMNVVTGKEFTVLAVFGMDCILRALDLYPSCHKILQESHVHLRENLAKTSRATRDNMKKSSKLMAWTGMAEVGKIFREPDEFYIVPDSTLDLIMNLLGFFFALYNFVIIPFRATFLIDPDTESMALDITYHILDHVGDLLFLVTFIARLTCVAFLDSHGQYVYNRREIRQRYLHSSLFIWDLIPLIPLDIIGVATGSETLASLRLNKFFQLARFQHYVVCIKNFAAYSAYISESTLRIGGLVLIIAVVTHLGACLWWFTTFSGVTHDDFMFHSTNWALRDEIIDNDVNIRYLRAYYWSLGTNMVIFAGDIVPLTLEETIAMVCVMLAGITFYGGFIANFAALVTNSNAHTIDFYTKNQEMIQFCRKNQDLGDELITSIRRYYQRILTHHKAIDDRQVFRLLPAFLRGALVKHLAKNNLDKLVLLLFKEDLPSRGFMEFLYQRVVPEIFVPDQFIVRAGQVGVKCFAILEGQVARVNPVTDRREQTLRAGMSFGSSVLLRPRQRQYSWLALSFVEAFTLHHLDMRKALDCFPADRANVLSRTPPLEQSKRRASFSENKSRNLAAGSATPKGPKWSVVREFSSQGRTYMINNKGRDKKVYMPSGKVRTVAYRRSFEDTLEDDGDGNVEMVQLGVGGTMEDIPSKASPSTTEEMETEVSAPDLPSPISDKLTEALKTLAGRQADQDEDQDEDEEDQEASDLDQDGDESSADSPRSRISIVSRSPSTRLRQLSRHPSRARTPPLPNNNDNNNNNNNNNNNSNSNNSNDNNNIDNGDAGQHTPPLPPPPPPPLPEPLSLFATESPNSSTHSGHSVAEAKSVHPSKVKLSVSASASAGKYAAKAKGKRKQKGKRSTRMSVFARAYTATDMEMLNEADDWSLPNSDIRTIWNTILIVAFLYNVFSIPFGIAFIRDNLGVDNFLFSLILDSLSDVLFLADMVLHFHYFIPADKEQNLILEVSSRHWHYLKGSFVRHLIGSVPWSIFVIGFHTDTSYYLRLLRLFRLPDVPVMLTSLQILGDVEMMNARIFKVFVCWIVVAHWFACTWFTIARTENAIQSWTNLLSSPPDDDDIWSNWLYWYLRSLYWVMTTMSGTGYGDLKPRTPTETVFSLFVQVTSALLFAIVIGSMTAIFNTKGAGFLRFEIQVNAVNRWMRWNKLPLTFQDRVRRYFDYLLLDQAGVDEKTILNVLPSNLRRQLLMHRCGDLIFRVPLLQGLSAPFLTSLAGTLTPRIYPSGDTICLHGEVSFEMYFIADGLVQVFLPADEEKAIASLTDNTFFGEIGMFLGIPRTSTCKASPDAHVKVLCLTREDLNEIVTLYDPSIAEVLNDRVGSLCEEYQATGHLVRRESVTIFGRRASALPSVGSLSTHLRTLSNGASVDEAPQTVDQLISQDDEFITSVISPPSRPTQLNREELLERLATPKSAPLPQDLKTFMFPTDSSVHAGEQPDGELILPPALPSYVSPLLKTTILCQDQANLQSVEPESVAASPSAGTIDGKIGGSFHVDSDLDDAKSAKMDAKKDHRRNISGTPLPMRNIHDLLIDDNNP